MIGDNSARRATAEGIEAVAPVAVSPNGVSGKKRPKEALLTLYGIGLTAKDYKRIARPAAQIVIDKKRL